MGDNISEKNILSYIYEFTNKYGDRALINALENYETSHQVYMYKTQTCIKYIPIYSIKYIEIFGHNIVIHTDAGILKKYGTLKKEYVLLKELGFVKCNQSFLIPIRRIREIRNKNVILETEEKFTLSRSCASEVICAYLRKNTK